MPQQNSDSLLELLEAAETPEDVEIVQQLWLESQGKDVSVQSGDKWTVSTLSDVAEFFGLDEHTVRVWRLKTPPMPGQAGKWPLKEIVRWRCDWIQQSELTTAKRQQEYDLGQIQVEQRRLELSKERGELLRSADVELWAAQALIELRESLLMLPDTIANSVQPDVRAFVREETDRHIRAALTATRRRLDEIDIECNAVS